MAEYSFQGMDKYGNTVRRTYDAQNRDSLAENLIKSGYTIISLSEKKNELNLDFIDSALRNMTKITTNDLVMVTIQLSNMLSAGMTLPASLSTLAQQTENKRMKVAISEISDEISQGKTFSEALAKHNDIFSNIFINMVAAGETSGNLDDILSRLAKFTEHEAELKQKISAAMMYPMILVIAGVTVVSFVTTTVIPPFVKIFSDAGVPLPLPTLILYDANLFIRGYWMFVIAGLAGVYIWLKQWAKNPAGKITIDNFKLRLPLWGDLLRKVEIARLSRTLSALLASGVPMIQALQVTEKTIDVEPIAVAIRNVSIAVGKGQSISGPLEASKQFPPMPVHMIAVGEETGTLEVMLNKIADFYDLATDYSIKKLTSLLEPIFLVVIAGLVGFIFASILLPIFNMVKTLKH